MTDEQFVPGVWRCAKCGFILIQRTLHTLDLGVTERDDPGEHCPNDGAPLWRMPQAQLDEHNGSV